MALNPNKLAKKRKVRKILPTWPPDKSCNSWAFFGNQGTGKTLGAMDLALKLAVKRKRGIVSNLDISPEGVYVFGEKYKIDWLKKMADEGQIVKLPTDHDIDLLFRYPRSVVIFDEAGALMFGRNFQKNNEEVIKNGIQLRKKFDTLIWTAQYSNQADRFLRETVERCVVCDGHQFFNSEQQIDVIVWRSEKHFLADQFWAWNDNKELQLKVVKTMLKTKRRINRKVNERDLYILNCFNSHSTVGSEIARPLQPIISNYKYRSDLPKDYYLSKMIGRNEQWDDPLTRYRYEMKPPTEKEWELYLENEYGFLMPPPKGKRIATAYHLDGYFETEKPLPEYLGYRKEKNTKNTNSNVRHFPQQKKAPKSKSKIIE